MGSRGRASLEQTRRAEARSRPSGLGRAPERGAHLADGFQLHTIGSPEHSRSSSSRSDESGRPRARAVLPRSCKPVDPAPELSQAVIVLLAGGPRRSSGSRARPHRRSQLFRPSREPSRHDSHPPRERASRQVLRPPAPRPLWNRAGDRGARWDAERVNRASTSASSRGAAAAPEALRARRAAVVEVAPAGRCRPRARPDATTRRLAGRGTAAIDVVTSRYGVRTASWSRRTSSHVRGTARSKPTFGVGSHAPCSSLNAIVGGRTRWCTRR